jgi:hypothetical protein
MISGDSLWIDEAYNARFALLQGWTEFLGTLLQDHRSENQMPFGMFYSWLGGRLFGTSEWALRGVNLLWGAITLGCFYRIGKKCEIYWLPIFMAVQPFLWYYMNEARPYGMQIAGGSLLFLAILEADENPLMEIRWLPAFVIGALVLCASSLLGAIPFFFYLLILLFVLIQRKYNISKLAFTTLSIVFLVLIVLGFFYLWTLFRGAGGAKIWKPGLENIIFSVYEFLGFTGLGPPRSDLRVFAKNSGSIIYAFGSYIPGLLILFGCYMSTMILFLKEQCFLSRSVKFAFVIIFCSLVVLLGASFIVKWPFWGRHLAAIFPLSVYVIAYPFRSLSRGNKIFRRIILICLFIALTVSSFCLRFSNNYQKDDYRSATAYAMTALANGGSVWWAADSAAAAYYELPLGVPDKNGSIDLKKAANIIGIPDSVRDSLQTPSVVILSKADIYDNSGSLQEWLRSHGYLLSKKLQSFSIYSRPE